MRVILLTHGGADLVIERLATLENVEIAGVFIETVTSSPRGFTEKVKRSIKYDGLMPTARKLLPTHRRTIATDAAVVEMTRETAAKFKIAVNEIDDFHSESSIDSMKSSDANLGVIYGTNIIRESVFSIPKLGSINLHQGLAPYYRGGPPVFWELYNDEREVGLTVHFVAAKVDSGDIVLQKAVPLKYDAVYGGDFERFIDGFRAGLRAESAKLVAEAVSAIASGDFDRMPQDTALGKRYRLPTKKEKDEMRRRLKARIARGADE